MHINKVITLTIKIPHMELTKQTVVNSMQIFCVFIKLKNKTGKRHPGL